MGPPAAKSRRRRRYWARAERGNRQSGHYHDDRKTRRDRGSLPVPVCAKPASRPPDQRTAPRQNADTPGGGCGEEPGKARKPGSQPTNSWPNIHGLAPPPDAAKPTGSRCFDSITTNWPGAASVVGLTRPATGSSGRGRVGICAPKPRQPGWRLIDASTPKYGTGPGRNQTRAKPDCLPCRSAGAIADRADSGQHRLTRT